MTGPKKQRDYFSGKKQCHTLKGKLILDPTSGMIVSVFVARGPAADLKVLDASGAYTPPEVQWRADRSYMGVAQRVGRLRVPHRKPPDRNGVARSLTDEQVAENRSLGRERVPVEHAVRRLKVFRIVSSRYRNRRRRFTLRLSLIAALVNRDTDIRVKANSHKQL